VTSLDDLSESPNSVLQSSIDKLESDVSKLEGALKDINEWDKKASKHLSKEIVGCIEHLRKIDDVNSSMQEFLNLKERYLSDINSREIIKEKLETWKEAGYVIKGIVEKLDGNLEELKASFEDMEKRISELESVQELFDSLKIDHFRAEAEEIEFKLNDPDKLEEIRSELEDLKNKISEDEEKRSEYRKRMKDYLTQGYMGAKKLQEFMSEDISIVEIEFKNFDKEVQLFKKYLKSTGFRLSDPGHEVEEIKEDIEEGNAEEESTEKVDVEEGNIEPESAKEKDAESPASLSDQTFSNFVQDHSNEIALTAAKEVSDSPGSVHNPLLILGDRGMGKTHLIRSIELSIHARDPKITVINMNGSEFVNRLRYHRESETMEDFRDLFRGADVLLMDDIDHLKTSEDGQAMFINIMNGMIDKGKQVVLTSEREIKSMQKVADQIRSRLDGGISVDLEGTTSELNKRLIDHFGSNKISENVKNYFATNLLGSIYEVKVAIQLFLDEQEENGRDPMEIARSVIDRISDDHGHRKLTEALEDTFEEIGVEVPGDVIICNNCEKEIPADSTTCPHCGVEFEDVEMKECPVCRQLSELDKDKCSSCGAPLK
jgi:chromosomal replication initiation ATPase DnaA